jgi:aryl-alcohol dehydrogenase-like predicted oxidoreductase
MSSKKRTRKTSEDDDDSSATEILPTTTTTSTTTTTTTTVLTTPQFGFGTLSLGVLYPSASQRPTEAESVALIHALLDAGVRFFDTADTYGADSSDLHYVERVIGRALKSYPGGVPADLIVATKGGMSRTKNGESSSSWMPGSNAPDAVKKQIRASFQALGGERPIDLWQIHHVNANKDKLIPATLAAMRAAHEMVLEGLVRRVGLCNATVAELEACARAGIVVASVQNEFSLFQQEAALPRKSASFVTSKRGVQLYCAEHDIPFIAYAPLGGLKARRAERSLGEFAPLVAAARRLGVSVHALCIALMAKRFAPFISIAGARTTAHALDSTQGAAAAFALLDRLNARERSELDGMWKEK